MSRLALFAVSLAVVSQNTLTAQILKEAHQFQISAAAIDEQKGLMATALSRSKPQKEAYAVARLWDLTTGRQLAVCIDEGPEQIHSIAISPASRLIAFSGVRSTVFNEPITYLWRFAELPADKATGARRTTTERLKVWPKIGGALAFSPDGKLLVIATKNGPVNVTATDGDLNWKRVADVSCRGEVAPVFSPDGSQVYVAARSKRGDNYALELDPRTGKLGRRFPQLSEDGKTDLPGLITSIATSPDGRFLATARASQYSSKDDAILLWDRETGQKLRPFPFNGYRTSFTADSKQVTGIAIHGALSKWDIETGEESFHRTKYQPRREIDRERDISTGATAEISPLSTMAVLSSPLSPFCVQAEVYSFASGKPLARILHTSKSRDWSVKVANTVIEPDTKLDISSSAANEVRLAIAPTARKPAEDAIGSRLFYLGIGVAKYKYPNLNLGYTGRDIEETTKFFREQKKVARYTDVLVSELRDKEATVKNMNHELGWLVDSCLPQDVAIVQFAGHGANVFQGLYFLPYEADEQSIGTTCFNWTQLTDKLSKIKAKHIIVLLDCCHAGAFGLPQPNQVEHARELIKNPRVIVLCASTAKQTAGEKDDLQHGIFTFSLLEALRGKADSNSDSVVALHEAFSYVIKDVEKRSGGKQTPVLFRTDEKANPEIAVVQK